jgi:hypothetical protein
VFYITVPAPILNDIPQPYEVSEILGQCIATRAFRDGADNCSAFEPLLGQQVLDKFTKPVALIVLLDACGNAHARAARQQHQMACRQSNVGCESCSLVA